MSLCGFMGCATYFFKTCRDKQLDKFRQSCYISLISQHYSASAIFFQFRETARNFADFAKLPTFQQVPLEFANSANAAQTPSVTAGCTAYELGRGSVETWGHPGRPGGPCRELRGRRRGTQGASPGDSGRSW